MARPAISGDGRFVAFDSMADNLVDDDNNSSPTLTGEDVFVHTRSWPYDTLGG